MVARRGRGTPATAAITALVRPPLRVMSGSIAAFFYIFPFFSCVWGWAMSRGQAGALARAHRSGGVATSSGQGCINTTRGASLGATLGVAAVSVRGRRGRGGHAPVAPSRFAAQRGGGGNSPHRCVNAGTASLSTRMPAPVAPLAVSDRLWWAQLGDRGCPSSVVFRGLHQHHSVAWRACVSQDALSMASHVVDSNPMLIVVR